MREIPQRDVAKATGPSHRRCSSRGGRPGLHGCGPRPRRARLRAMTSVAARRQERRAVSHRRPPAPGVPMPLGPPPSIDDLAGRWWTALEVGESAVRAAGLYLSGQEIAERHRLLRAERAESMELLSELARTRHDETRLLRLLAAPALRRSMLGLPEHVTACVFELDGVLTTSAAVHAAAWAETFDAFLAQRAEGSHRPFVP